jgi:hypothetical protein
MKKNWRIVGVYRDGTHYTSSFAECATLDEAFLGLLMSVTRKAGVLLPENATYYYEESGVRVRLFEVGA